MLSRRGRWQLIFIVISAIFALQVRSTLAIVTLIVVNGLVWFINYLNQQEHIEVLETDAKRTKDDAQLEVDDAYDKINILLQAIPSALGYIDQKGKFDVTNQLFDYLVEPKNKTVFDATIDVPIRKVLLDAFLGEKQFIRQISYRDTDYQILSVPFFTDKDRYNGCMVIFQDVTRIVEGEKVQRRFIADASHELRTPITAIKGMVEILNRESFNDPDTLKEFLKQIEKENGRLDKIVEDLLLQSRLSANQVRLERSFVSLKSFLEGIVYDKRREIQSANIDVTIECSDRLSLFADPFRLSQVFINLINNSINYTKNGKILIECRKHDQKTQIVFEDNGAGMSPDILPHIFERFVRGDVARGRDSGGTGLGLAITKSIVDAHGGTIEVQSEVGKGTRFIIIL